jgi:hypothetical protein
MEEDKLPQVAPAGYHFFGELPKLKEDGKPTNPIRRNSEKARALKYADLYFQIEMADDKVGYICCMAGCERGSDTSAVVMVRKGNYVVFQNFFDHLQRAHPEQLEQSDRALVQEKKRQAPTSIDSFLTRIDSVQPSKKYVKTKHTPKYDLVVKATAKVICHGAYPLSYLCNSAQQDYLTELNIVEPGFIFPRRSTITAEVDRLLTAENNEAELNIRNKIKS